RFAQMGLYDPEDEEGDGTPAGPGFQLDPFADDFAEQLAARDAWLLDQYDQRLQQRFAPYEAQQDARVRAEGKQHTLDQFAAMTDLGKFDHERAFVRAQELAAGVIQRFGTDDPRVVGPHISSVV